MNIKQVTGIYFSPTGSSGTVVRRLASRLRDGSETVDLTDARRKWLEYHFTENELAVVGVPVYGGRVPKTAIERIRHLHGRQTPVVAVVVYGNRAYEDALIELTDILRKQGFCPVAGAAVSAQHNIVCSIAADRPDAQDYVKLDAFADKVRARMAELPSTYRLTELSVKGDRPYRARHAAPLKIKVSASCNECGTCIRKCPVQAISRTDPKVTDEERCISCMRCVHDCPQNARKVSPLMMMAISQKLKKVCAERREPEFFL